MKIGSLCTGYGGLDLAVEAFFNAETIWCAENDKYASQVIEQRFGIPNHGDIKQIDWAKLPEINILTAGYPCQPFSHAGERKGTNDPRHIWPHIQEAISILRPQIVIMENVRGHLTLGFKEVLKGLAEIRYDAKWTIVRASDAGAPHRRERLFIIAQPANANSERSDLGGQDSIWDKGQSQFEFNGMGATTTSNFDSDAQSESRRTDRSIYGSPSEIINRSNRNELRSSSSIIADTIGERFENQLQTTKSGKSFEIRPSYADNEYQPHNGQVSSIRRRFTARCEMHLQTPPNPLDQGKLNAKFVEYMMGLQPGWVTDIELSRSQQLKMLGNGVVPQQAELALELLTGGN